MGYINKQFSIHKPILKWLLNLTLGKSDPNYSLFVVNFIYRLFIIGVYMRYHKKEKMFSIHDKEKVHFFGNLIRGIGLYSNGLANRADQLFDSYLLKNISFTKENVVIDCGANYADLWLALEGKINNDCYHTFEPGTIEHESIKKNAPNGNHNNVALSNKEGVSRFYINHKDGDSSIIQPSVYTDVIDIKTTTLSKYVKEQKIKKIKLLKLEAEGFEPEILEGTHDVLDRIDYIAVDGGHERGNNNEETFSELCNSLLVANFRLVSISFYRQRALFVQNK